jgi:hypothetical protein
MILDKTDVTEERAASNIRMGRISELGTTLSVTGPHGIICQKTASFVIAGVETSNVA